MTKSVENWYLIFLRECGKQQLHFLLIISLANFEKKLFWHVMQYLEKTNSENHKKIKEPSIHHKLTYWEKYFGYNSVSKVMEIKRIIFLAIFFFGLSISFYIKYEEKPQFLS